MLSQQSLISEMESAIASGSSEKRVETLRKVTNLFLDESNRLNEQQIGVFDDVLVHLIKRIETKALVQLGSALAPVDNAPLHTIRNLARHDELAVAGPVLTRSSRLSDGDLVEIARTKGQGHLLAISVRSSLSESVTDVLVERGDREVTYSLARNAGARFSDAGFANLVNRSHSDERLAEKLGLRLDIPLSLLRQLLARATDLVRSRLLSAATPENREKIQRALSEVVNEVGREAAGPRDFTRADNLVHELNRHGKLKEATLLEFARDRRYEEMTATLALFCGARSDLVERLMKNVNAEGLLVACKAAKLSWPTVSLILKVRFPHHQISNPEIETARTAFLELSQAAAQRTMRFMMVQEIAKAS